ncbi:hypothetical protein BV22DRAFT_607995 [Leucogyrophana mollusca]|uniref:Uncharacterized protein n=1 Tax=Leucogyrophana mollusca TaxID=85980 RepID=A0ACB8BBE2_9AGAM|nr:hypothetical protein BV22DRAFT_607995 [Leucogyrophana mollusca]
MFMTGLYLAARYCGSAALFTTIALDLRLTWTRNVHNHIYCQPMANHCVQCSNASHSSRAGICTAQPFEEASGFSVGMLLL